MLRRRKGLASAGSIHTAIKIVGEIIVGEIYQGLRKGAAQSLGPANKYISFIAIAIWTE